MFILFKNKTKQKTDKQTKKPQQPETELLKVIQVFSDIGRFQPWSV